MSLTEDERALLLDNVKAEFFALLDTLWAQSSKDTYPDLMVAYLRSQHSYGVPVNAWLYEWEARHINEWSARPR